MMQRNSALSLSLSHMHMKSKIFTMPLSDADIITLHAMFLTQGVHYITVATPEIGRKLMYTIVESLVCYKSVAALSVAKTMFQPSIYDVYTQAYEYLLDADLQDIFFVEYFYCDFLWIEVTQELLDTPWYYSVKNKLITHNKNHTIPIVMVLYQPYIS